MAIITIGGNVGAGKTTLAEKLARSLGYEDLYMGGIFRQMAAERKMSIEDFYAKLKEDPDLERSADQAQSKLMQKKDNLVIQGRIAWFFAKESPFTTFNIFLAVDPEAGAKRTGERPENAGRSLAELRTANALRTKQEVERYNALYGIKNFLDLGHYDFVLDTSHLTEDQVLEKVFTKIKERLDADV